VTKILYAGEEIPIMRVFDESGYCTSRQQCQSSAVATGWRLLA